MNHVKSLAVKILNMLSGGKFRPTQPVLGQREFAQALQGLMEVEPWVIDFFEVTGNEMEMRGWAIPPRGNPARVSFLINNQKFPVIQYPQPRQDIKDLFWYLPKQSDSGYTCRGAMPENTNEDILFKYVHKWTKKPLKQGHVYYYNHQRARQLPIPEAFRRMRVHGGDSEGTFLLEGCTTFRKLEMALEQTLGQRYEHFPRILDWGCGCGRMARYFAELQNLSFTGVDIDADNVQWCQNNLGFGQFHAIPTHPPTDLPPASFDLLIGISIFTHLREKEQFEWLDELRRIAADGAILLMTVHGNTTVGQANFTHPLLDTLQQHGFLDIGLNPNLNDVESIQTDTEYYRNTFHTRDYLLREWGRYFELVDIIPGYIGNHQDLVVMRKSALP